MTIDDLVVFCKEEEYNHRLKCKRYDDASGYTRSKDKNTRTAYAIIEDTYANFYKEIIETMRKYQMFQADYEARLKADLVAMLTEIQLEIEEIDSRAGYDRNGMPTISTDYVRIIKVNEIIQQKIDKLKEVEK